LKTDLFRWYRATSSGQIDAGLGNLAARMEKFDLDLQGGEENAPTDLLAGLYQDLIPRRVRHALGEYYTPEWLVEHILDEVEYAGQPEVRILDPACGSGTFLIAAIARAKKWTEDHQGPRDGKFFRRITSNVVGFDLNPLAVLSARANYLIALGRTAKLAHPIEVPVYERDSILGSGDAPGPGLFQVVVGNPPWIAWDHLPDAYREATKSLWQHYGLFSLSASDARHGGGKKDLSMLMLYVCADRYLEHSGRLGFVITQSAFQTKGAGDGFRRFRAGQSGPWLRVLRVNDLADFQPFAPAANWTGTILLEKGSPTIYPVPYIRWQPSAECSGKPILCDGLVPCPNSIDGLRAAELNRAIVRREYSAEPIDPRRLTSPWFLRPNGLEAPLDRLIGPSDYCAHLGANTGGANAVYWLQILGRAGDGIMIRNDVRSGKGDIPAVEATIEPEFLYPLIRWRDVSRFKAQPSGGMLLVQDVDKRRGIDEPIMRHRYPRTYRYLRSFQPELTARAAYRRYQHRAPFYSMYDVGRYTVAPIKVVWRRMDRRLNAAVVELVDDPVLGLRPVVPQETCVLIAVEAREEAHYLCALLNSAIVGFLVASHSVRGGKGYGTPSMLDYIRLRRFDRHRPEHLELAQLSLRAHQMVQEKRPINAVQERIDRVAGQLWDLSGREIDVVRRQPAR
jgi:hypothetical protein